MFNITKFDDIKFCANDETNMHCVPATFCMIMSRLAPEMELGLTDLVTLCGGRPGNSVWPARLLINLQKMGIESVMVEAFDARAFINEGEAYLRREFGDTAADWMVEESDIPKEQANYQDALDSGVVIEKRVPTVNDLRKRLGEGWMVKCNINSRKLSGQDGYVGHSVLILDINDQSILIHNPGLPPKPFQEVSIEDFEAAWASPNDEAKDMVAVRKSKS